MPLPDFGADGLLPHGEHQTTWDELRDRFSLNALRSAILEGIRQAAMALARAKCRRLWVDGSFVTSKADPSDWDGCWDPVGVDPALLDPVLLDLHTPAGRHRMKAKYLADLFPASVVEGRSGLAFVKFFQVDKVSGNHKGIVVLDLAGWSR